MRKILKGQPPGHLVIVDTNILWCKDKGPAVSPEFDKFWSDHEGIVSMELVIPEVVRGEILFQHTTSAIKTLSKIKESFHEISSITAKTHTHRMTEDTIKKQIEVKFNRWLKSKHARIADIPINSIDWKVLCDAAIWRKPPFTMDPKNPDLEKGFRDALILETITEVASLEARQIGIVFICNDSLLRTTAEQRMGGEMRFSTYEGLADFSSYIRLTKEKLTNEFIKEIQARAREKFYSPNDSNSLWIREKLRDKIRADFAEKFDNPDETIGIGSLLATLSGSKKSWEASDDGRWWIYRPEFVKLVSPREYHWKNRVRFIRSYKKIKSEGSSLNLDELLESTEKVLFLDFFVYWNAKVKADARFHDVTFENIEFSSKNFRVPTEDEVRQYQLQKTNIKE